LDINGTPDEAGSGLETFGPGILFVGAESYHTAPSDPYIIVNSTNFTGTTNNEYFHLPPGRCSLAWSYETSNCSPAGG
jgi:hypothetical protein